MFRMLGIIFLNGRSIGFVIVIMNREKGLYIFAFVNPKIILIKTAYINNVDAILIKKLKTLSNPFIINLSLSLISRQSMKAVGIFSPHF